MKIRLSMPSTTSMAISVTIAAQPSGLVRKAKWVAKNSVIGRLLGYFRAAQASAGPRRESHAAARLPAAH